MCEIWFSNDCIRKDVVWLEHERKQLFQSWILTEYEMIGEYGHGFWTNEKGKLWPDLPREGFTAWGAGGHYVVVFPSYDLVVVMNPTPYPGASQPYETHTVTWEQQQEVLSIILDGCEK